MSAKLLAMQKSKALDVQRSDDSDGSDSETEKSSSISSNADISDEDEHQAIESQDDESDKHLENHDVHTHVSSADLDETTINRSMTFVCEALCDFDFGGEASNSLSFCKGNLLTVTGIRSDGWWEAEDQEENKGMVPSQFLKVPEKIQPLLDGLHSSSTPHEKGHWGKLRHSVHQSQAVENAVVAFGALPVGFCGSTLGQLLQEDSRYTTEAFLIPKLRETGLSFQDLHWCNSSSSLKPFDVPLQKIIRLMAFRDVINPSQGFDVESRHVRVCLHDGSKVLSNIHTVRAQWNPKSPKIWTFIRKIEPSDSCIEEGQFFLRCNTICPTIGILFQLCISYSKKTTGEHNEMSCGWVFMRLVDDSGASISSGGRILQIQPGVPFIAQMNSPSSSDIKSSKFKMFTKRGEKPRLVISILDAKNKINKHINFLPNTLVGPVSSIPLLAFYRKILADKLLKQRPSCDSTELIHSPFLSNFSKLFKNIDVLDAYRRLWSKKVKKLKAPSAEKEKMRKIAFEQMFMEMIFPLLQCVSLKPYHFDSIEREKERKNQIESVLNKIKEDGPLGFVMSTDYGFHPLSMSCLAIDIVARNSRPIEGLE